MDGEKDVLALVDRQMAGTRLPAERLRLEVTTVAGHDPDHRRTAADLTGDIDQPPPLRMQPERQPPLLPAEMTMPALHKDPPVISDYAISQDSLR
ncbi:hypothetical protein ADK75_11850 [Streptomyces virginiae]|uniref:Uncharacterized protein n=1 Tax=Streptomyces virginiae TaxID=1961 RepID=A0A0L8MXH8_STRVG|nr:hypothetical protein ADK75_11850 [Streptomyces virginiae]